MNIRILENMIILYELIFTDLYSAVRHSLPYYLLMPKLNQAQKISPRGFQRVLDMLSYKMLRDIVNEEVTKMLQQGILQPSSSSWSSQLQRLEKSWHVEILYRSFEIKCCHSSGHIPTT